MGVNMKTIKMKQLDEKETNIPRGYMFSVLTDYYDAELIEFGREPSSDVIEVVGNIYENPEISEGLKSY
jgi:hypothetical protein